MTRIESEKHTIETMIRLYCRRHEGKSELCEECRTLLDYAHSRLDHCPFGEQKPTCRVCPIHCYKPAMKQRIQTVMRWSGPRLLIYQPKAVIMHTLRELHSPKPTTDSHSAPRLSQNRPPSHPKERYIGRTLCSFLLVLLLMPLGHALMILMEHFLDETTLHFTAFAMGFVGMLIVIAGIFYRSDTRQTVCGLAGGLLFWTGWVEFLFSYYAWRYGVHCDLVGNGVITTTTEYAGGIGVTHDFLVNGLPLESFTKPELKALRGSRPEYLILPATFGLWMMCMMLYIFSTRTGCACFNWIQTKLRLKTQIQARPLVRNSAMVTFMELNMMLWTLYLLLMLCYDPLFLGSDHPFTFAIGLGCLIGSGFMLAKMLKIKPWGANIRMAIATVLVFWSFVEIVARNGLLNEIWVDPLGHIFETALIVASFLALIAYAVSGQSSTKQR